MKKVLSIFMVILSCQLLIAQTETEPLLIIDDEPIHSDEFLRIYNKNSSITLEEKKSVEEYLDLFINYKLKVIEAENLSYDTVSSFVKEMEGYTKQLAKPYLDKSSLIDSFIQEAYEHYIEEIKASHILLKINKDALPKDTARVYNRIMELREEILSGKDWDKVIDDNSPNPDPAKRIGGDLGWFNGFRMVYPFESAAYQTPVGEVSMPVRTIFGYHLIKVHDRRPNRGEANVRHIMASTPRNPTDADISAARMKIEEAYKALEQGADWDSITLAYSDHKGSAPNGGKLGYLKSGNAPEVILDTCFGLEAGEYSEIFRSIYGFHIVKVDDFKPVQSFEEVKDDFEKKIRQSGEVVSINNEQRLARIKDEYGFAFYEESLKGLYDVVDSTILTGDWDAELAKDLNDTVFFIGDSIYTQYDAAKVVGARRLANKAIEIKVAIRKRVIEMAENKVLSYELNMLPSKYPEYRYLLEEYHDGILLFNLTEDVVWRKAVEDTTGLLNFYNELPEKYQWEERVAMTKYTYSDSLLTTKLLKLAKKRAKKGLDSKTLSAKVCGQDTVPCINFVEMKYEKGDNAVADGMNWESGTYLTSKDKDNFVLYYVDGVLEPQMKKLEDARGLYTADYQAFLEEKWIQSLREKYTIQINEDELQRLIKLESE